MIAKLKSFSGIIILFAAALIWGSAFVWQKTAGEHIPPFTLNAIRFAIGSVVLLPFVIIIYRKERHAKSTIKYGILAGLALSAAANLQQFGINLSTSGKAGFITALYIVIVPILGLFIGKKATKLTWICVAAAIAGFLFLSNPFDGSGVGIGDILLLLGALGFAVQILLIDRYVKETDALGFCMVEFAVCAVISSVIAAVLEPGGFRGSGECVFELLYLGVLSSGLGYTFQVLGQRRADPAHASLIMSLESVFAVITGWLVLGEKLNIFELFGCILIFFAVIVASVLPEFLKKRRNAE